MTLLSSTFVIGSVAYAKHGDPKPSGKWMCYAEGQVRFGGPGSISQTVSGYGVDQQDASMEALNRCFAQGLQMCMVRSCFRN